MTLVYYIDDLIDGGIFHDRCFTTYELAEKYAVNWGLEPAAFGLFMYKGTRAACIKHMSLYVK